MLWNSVTSTWKAACIRAQGGCDAGVDLADEVVEVGIGWAFDIPVVLANVLDGFTVHYVKAEAEHSRAVCVVRMEL